MASDSLPVSPALPEEALSPALLDELLLEELLLEELLLEELLLDELLLGEGVEGDVAGGVDGVDGGCGWVGLLALGQPLNSRQAPAMPASCRSK